MRVLKGNVCVCKCLCARARARGIRACVCVHFSLSLSLSFSLSVVHVADFLRQEVWRGRGKLGVGEGAKGGSKVC